MSVKIALLGDVHANLPALESVLAHAEARGAQAIWNIGDFVGYGAYPEEVVWRLRREGALSIKGNYDLRVLKVKRKQKKWRKSKHPLKLRAFLWAYEHLSPKSHQYLGALPREIMLKLLGWRILLTHGSPASNKEHLTPATPPARLRELAEMAPADLIICGHSHQPFARPIDDVWFINTGSVGRPDDGDPRACYALLELKKKRLHVQHYRVEYPVERAVAAIRAEGLPEPFAQMMIQGVALDAVLDSHSPLRYNSLWTG